MQHPWFKEQLGDEVDKMKRLNISLKGRTGEFSKYLAMKKLKKAAFGYIASGMTQAEVGALEEQFQSMDSNHDGYITLTELDDAISRNTFNEEVLTRLREMRRDLAISDDERLNWRDFLALTMDRSLAVREDNLKTAFEHFKHTDADYLTVSDLAEIFGGEAQARDVMHLIDADGDGKVSYEDFRFALVESLDDVDDDDESDHF